MGQPPAHGSRRKVIARHAAKFLSAVARKHRHQSSYIEIEGARIDVLAVWLTLAWALRPSSHLPALAFRANHQLRFAFLLSGSRSLPWRATLGRDAGG